jgi:hypothetical protein
MEHGLDDAGARERDRVVGRVVGRTLARDDAVGRVDHLPDDLVADLGRERTPPADPVPVEQRHSADGRRAPQRQLAVTVLARDVRVHVLHRNPGLLRDEVAQAGGVEDGSGAEQLGGRQPRDLQRGVGHDVHRVGDHEVDRVRGDLDERRQHPRDERDRRLGEVEARLAGLLLGARGDDDHVGIRAHRDVVGPEHLGDGHELDAVPQVERLGLDLGLVDVIQRDGPRRAAHERRVGDRRPDGPRTDHGGLGAAMKARRCPREPELVVVVLAHTCSLSQLPTSLGESLTRLVARREAP